MLFEAFNKGLSSVLHVGGHGSHDEAIWEYFREFFYVVYIPNKPHNTDICCYKWCFILTQCSRPVVFWVLSDISISTYTGTETIDVFLLQ